MLKAFDVEYKALVAGSFLNEVPWQAIGFIEAECLVTWKDNVQVGDDFQHFSSMLSEQPADKLLPILLSQGIAIRKSLCRLNDIRIVNKDQQLGSQILRRSDERFIPRGPNELL